ncbi:hypothetical protein PIB30_100241 [Stylosanthes scabra]|uniref:Uncharacterized protein n=1 Tax=Stylosanthes scabra TaxID=79078 RepID=A0ABU6XUN4_9FABA|nr:hypothetical protein [Stylosanthes scabra]
MDKFQQLQTRKPHILLKFRPSSPRFIKQSWYGKRPCCSEGTKETQEIRSFNRCLTGTQLVDERTEKQPGNLMQLNSNPIPPSSSFE